MDEELSRNCTSLVFQLAENSAVYDFVVYIIDAYDKIFFYFLVYIGPVVVLANLFAIFILARKELRTPYNIVFLVMAVNQGLTILCRVILLWPFLLNIGCNLPYILPWVLFENFVANFSPIFTSHISWLAVIITFLRIRNLKTDTKEPSVRFMISMCFVSFGLILLASVPLFLSLDIIWQDMYTNCEGRKLHQLKLRPVPFVVESKMLYQHDCLLLRITYFSSGVLLNALPCILLVILSLVLTFRVKKIYKAHRALVADRSPAARADSTRTSLMISMIVCTTMLTDIPQAAVNILVGLMAKYESIVSKQEDLKISHLMVTLVMIASACNLTIHLCMSRQFREVTKTYLCCVCGKSKRKISVLRVSSSNEFSYPTKQS